MWKCCKLFHEQIYFAFHKLINYILVVVPFRMQWLFTCLLIQDELVECHGARGNGTDEYLSISNWLQMSVIVSKQQSFDSIRKWSKLCHLIQWDWNGVGENHPSDCFIAFRCCEWAYNYEHGKSRRSRCVKSYLCTCRIYRCLCFRSMHAARMCMAMWHCRSPRLGHWNASQCFQSPHCYLDFPLSDRKKLQE